MKSPKKLIFHIDLNAFYCQCAENRESFLKNVPFAISNNYNTNRGIISTSNYIARKYGVFSAMNVAEAKKKCPFLRLVPPDYKLYQNYSNIFFNFLKKLTKKIKIASIDEAYLDLSDHKLSQTPLKLAELIQKELVKRYNLPTSIGISNSLFLAKMASDFKKPLGITMIDEKNLNILDNLDIKAIYGIGQKTEKTLKENEIFKIKDFKNTENRQKLISLLGERLYLQKIKELNGLSSDFVEETKRIPKSISCEKTLIDELDDLSLLKEELKILSKRVFEDFKQMKKVYIKSIFIRFREKNKNSKTKQLKLDKKITTLQELKDSVVSFFETIYEDIPLKNIGCGINIEQTTKNITSKNLFNYDKIEKEEAIKKAISGLDERLKKTVKYKDE